MRKILKILYFIPTIIFTLFYGFVIYIAGIGSVFPIVACWLASLWMAGILLIKDIWWGGLLGCIPALCFIYMGTQDTGQIINETPIGIVLLVYYVLCCYVVYRKKVN